MADPVRCGAPKVNLLASDAFSPEAPLRAPTELGTFMSRNGLYALIALLAVIVVGLAGYMLYQRSQEPSLEIKLDSNGLQVTGNG